MELFLIAIAYLLGILSGLYLKIGIAIFAVLSVILWFLRKKNKYIKLFCSKKYIILILFSFVFSYFQIIYLEYNFNEKYKDIQCEIKVLGIIISNPIEKEYKTSYTLKVLEINGNKSFKNTNLILYVKKEKNAKTYKYGDKILFYAEFELPEVQRNTGGFSYKDYLKTKKIYGIVTTSSSKIKLEKENNVNTISIFANKISEKIKEKANLFLTKEEASILVGILIGNKDNLEESTKETFRRSNLSHILAVSGAHVSYVIMGIGFIISKSKISINRGKTITILLLIFFMILTRSKSIGYKSLHYVYLYDSCKYVS